ncbi:hypothetical protein GQ55_9G493300 [Panicum hallii var. hallii]|uniref:Uncharacterized protein n=1 Tax=Panicum hallii var. hallii TaxID=1504633 RepID=A0A2T7CDA3_9POAL|nr:hypothetical protein GQ55_9G493300 [Panicum hallii var. hallii]
MSSCPRLERACDSPVTAAVCPPWQLGRNLQSRRRALLIEMFFSPLYSVVSRVHPYKSMPCLCFHSPSLTHYFICLNGAVVPTFIHQNAAATLYTYRSASNSPTVITSSPAPAPAGPLRYILLFSLPIFLRLLCLLQFPRRYIASLLHSA